MSSILKLVDRAEGTQSYVKIRWGYAYEGHAPKFERRSQGDDNCCDKRVRD